jgi:acetyltransferase-like isoleucine patch superfamily enzyme
MGIKITSQLTTFHFLTLAPKLLVLKLFNFSKLKLRSLFIGIELSSKLKLFGSTAKITIGKWSYIRKRADLECHNGEIIIGDRVFINKYCTIISNEKITIGNNCMFGEDVSIYDHDHRYELSGIPFRDHGFTSKPVIIGNNVWLGCKVFDGKGVVIGDNVVVADGSIVTKHIPSNSIYSKGDVRSLIGR